MRNIKVIEFLGFLFLTYTKKIISYTKLDVNLAFYILNTVSAFDLKYLVFRLIFT